MTESHAPLYAYPVRKRGVRRHSQLGVALLIGVATLLTGCSPTPSITGVWTASDGSVTKTISEDGSCTGMYYNAGQVLDIGGPATCQLSENATDGFYDLIVRQAPNQQTLQVRFDGDTMILYSDGQEIVTLTKQ